MNRVVFAMLEILAAAVFLVPIFWFWYRELRKAVAYCIFSFYLVAVYSLVGLPTVLYSRFDANLNLIPFAGMAADWKNCILNVLLFVPLGFLLPVFWEPFRTQKKTLLFGFGMSLAIEVFQIFTLRATDINDVITNTLGAYLGFLLAGCMIKRLPVLRKIGEGMKTGELRAVCFIVVAVMVFLQPFLAAALWELIMR